MDVSDHASVKVDKNIPLEVDLQCLTANNLESDARDGIQILINAIFECPTVSNEDGVFATLPRSMKNQIPRAKPIPKQKPMTRWEKFAAAKGIQKTKKKRVVFDENTGEYRPTFGYKNQGKSGKDLSDWIKEVPDETGNNLLIRDPTTDMYQADREEKKKRVEKNQMQQRRNQEESYAKQKGLDHKSFKKQMLYKQIVDANVSTASMGKFDPKLKNDNVKVKGVKRKFESSTGPVEVEKQKNLDIAEKIGKPKKEEINVRQAVNVHSSKRRKNQKSRRVPIHHIDQIYFVSILLLCIQVTIKLTSSDVKSMPQKLVSEGATCIQVDTNRMKEIASKFRITGYPSFQFFVNGTVFSSLILDPVKIPEVLRECILAQSKYHEAKSGSHLASLLVYDGLSACLFYSSRHQNHKNHIFSMISLSRFYPTMQFCGIDEMLGIDELRGKYDINLYPTYMLFYKSQPCVSVNNESQIIEKLKAFEKSGYEGIVTLDRNSKKVISDESYFNQSKVEKRSSKVSQSQTAIEKSRSLVPAGHQRNSLLGRRISLGTATPAPIDTTDSARLSRKGLGDNGLATPISMKSDSSSLYSSPQVSSRRRSTMDSGSGTFVSKGELRPKNKGIPVSPSIMENAVFDFPEEIFEDKRNSVFITPASQSNSRAVEILVQSVIDQSAKLVLADDGYSIVEQIDAIPEIVIAEHAKAIRQEQLEETFFLQKAFKEDNDIPIDEFVNETKKLRDLLPQKEYKPRSRSPSIRNDSSKSITEVVTQFNESI
ncbi:Rhodanese- sulfurtransferase [Terramyces sp. JEL0728]|nr:Rhodanese- sulfurtransferase [Terramyces sp. JEL0728]